MDMRMEMMMMISDFVNSEKTVLIIEMKMMMNITIHGIYDQESDD